MSKLSDAAKRVNAMGPIWSGREGLNGTKIINLYPAGIHVNRIEPNTYKGAHGYIFTFTEDVTKYSSSNTVMTEKLDNLLDIYEGDLSELNRDLAENPLHVYLSIKNKDDGSFYYDCLFIGDEPAEKSNAAEPVKEFGIAEIEDATVENDGDILPPF